MSRKTHTAIVREHLEELKKDREQEERISRRMKKWGQATAILGIGLVVSVAAVVPFLAGYPLHDRWDEVGKRVLLLAMVLLTAFTYVGGTYLTFWYYLRSVKRLHRRFAPSVENEPDE